MEEAYSLIHCSIFAAVNRRIRFLHLILGMPIFILHHIFIAVVGLVREITVVSREGGALVVYDLLKYIVKNSLGVVWVLNVLSNSQDVSALSYVVVDVFVLTLVSELCQTNPIKS